MVAINRVNGRAPYFHSRGSVRESARKTRAHAYIQRRASFRRGIPPFISSVPPTIRERRVRDDAKDEGRRGTHRTRDSPVRGRVILRHQCPFTGFMELLRLATGLSSGGEIPDTPSGSILSKGMRFGKDRENS